MSPDTQISSSQPTEIRFPGGKIKITLDSGVGLQIPKEVGKKREFTPNQMLALAVMHLAVPLAFPDEATNTDSQGFRVEVEGNIVDLPGFREDDPKGALKWAGAILQAGKIKAGDVADALTSMYPARFNQNTTGLLSAFYKNRLRTVIAGFYPGARGARARRKPAPSW